LGAAALDLIVEAFTLSLLSIAAAEFGDKTQLGLIMLAASLPKPRLIFLGMIAGYVFVAGVGVLVGQALLTIVPLSVLVLVSGFIFVTIGLLMLRTNVDNVIPAKYSGSNPFQAASLLIVLTELGDKTQIVTVALAARFAQPVAVFLGVLLAFAVVEGLSIMLAGNLGRRLPRDKVRRGAAIVFMALGVLTLLGIL